MTERTYTATQESPPDGAWTIKITEGDIVVEDQCGAEYKVETVEALKRRMEARINPKAEPELPLGVTLG
jgi:hypothetical protein